MGNADIFSPDDQGVAPAVFGAEGLDEDELADELEADSNPAETTPPQPQEQAFVIPAEEATPPQSEVTVQLARTPDDELVMLAFSTPERLAACLGNEQPWIAIPKSELQPVQHACEADILEIDPVLPAD
ncbi:SAV_915 family protein [Parasphingorhabdus pacifica]